MSTGTTRFHLYKKTDKAGKKPIFLTYCLKSEKCDFRPKLKLFPANWDKNKQQAIYLDRKEAKQHAPEIKYDYLLGSKEVTELNETLEGYRLQVLNIEKRFELDKVPYTSKMVVEKLNDLKNAKTTTEKEIAAKTTPDQLFFFMDKYIADHAATRKKGSLSVYKSLKNHLKEYEEEKQIKVTFANLNYDFFQNFQNFLLTPRLKFIPSKSPTSEQKGSWKTISLNNTTVTKQLSTIKTFINYARRQGQPVNDKYKDFKLKKEELEVIALTNEEFETLFNMDLSGNKRMAEIRDILCFSCATSLRYSDLAQLEWIHINRQEIRLVVTKTSRPLVVPLNPYSHAILEKYKGTPRPLPSSLINGRFKLLSNQKLNDGINGKDEKDAEGKVIKHQKGLCELAGIDEPVEIVRFRGAIRETITYPKYELISIHNGRKTFATLSLERGMSAEQVMAIGGWSDYKSFKRYVKVTEKHQKAVMAKAWGAVPKADLKVV